MNGEHYRIFVDGKMIEAEKSCELHISVETEIGNTKDTSDNGAEYPEAVSFAWDATAVCELTNKTLVASGTSIKASKIDPNLDTSLHEVKIAVNTDKPTSEETLVQGSAHVTSISYKSDNKKKVEATVKFQGSGAIGAPAETSDLQTE